MTAPTIPALVADLVRAFPNRGIHAAQYERDLADVPIQALTDTVRSMLRTAREWPPSVGEIREHAAARILGIPADIEALTQIDRVIEWGRGDRTEPRPELHPLAQSAVRHVGGWYNLRASEKPEITRAQMMKYFREARAARVREAADQRLDMPILTMPRLMRELQQ